MLIRTYGTHWNPNAVQWGQKTGGQIRSSLDGVCTYQPPKVNGAFPRKVSFNVNVWNGIGVYVLFKDFSPVYIGKAVKTPLGARLKTHLTDRFSGRWDTFSFYITNKINTSPSQRKMQNLEAGSLRAQTTHSNIAETLESLLIELANPPLNRKRESVPDAIELEQVDPNTEMTIESYLEQILEEVRKKSG